MQGIPLYQQILSWVDFAIGSVIYPLGVLVVLVLAWLEFRKLVAYLTSKS